MGYLNFAGAFWFGLIFVVVLIGLGVFVSCCELLFPSVSRVCCVDFVSVLVLFDFVFGVYFVVVLGCFCLLCYSVFVLSIGVMMYCLIVLLGEFIFNVMVCVC